jgi:hypothetical protein
VTHPYNDALYARTLAHVGAPFWWVPEWGAGLIMRQIPGGGTDVVGTYPITVFKEGADIAGGLERLRAAGFVSVTLVCDDFHRPDHLPGFDVVREFKSHYLHRGPGNSFGNGYYPHQEHRRKIRRAKRDVVCREISLKAHLNEWCALYDCLIRRHILTGVHAFPRESFAALSEIEGITAIGGFVGDEMVCCNIWAVHEGRAHSHLVASNEKGYELRAAYAVTDFAMRHFMDCDVINLGGPAGNGDADDGLAQFKRGFSNATAPAWICGAVLNREAYDALSAGKTTDYFPAYRG